MYVQARIFALPSDYPVILPGGNKMCHQSVRICQDEILYFQGFKNRLLAFKDFTHRILGFQHF